MPQLHGLVTASAEWEMTWGKMEEDAANGRDVGAVMWQQADVDVQKFPDWCLVILG